MSEKTYLAERLEKLNLKPEDISMPKVMVNDVQGTEGIMRAYSYHPAEKIEFFSQGKDHEGKLTDDIDIHYYTEYGGIRNYVKAGTKWPRPFIRTRFKNPQNPEQKYQTPSGAKVEPFMTPKVIDAYILKKEIKTLIITEGELKAYKGDQMGLFVIGISGIQNFGGDLPGSLHHSILNILKVCKVENVILLHDADAFTVNWNKDKELSTRPANFISAVSGFREAIEPQVSDQEYALKNVFYYAIARRFCKEEAKGLDDLFCAYPARAVDIIKDLTETYAAPGEFFTGINITAWSRVDKKLYKDFGLYDAEAFYKVYQEYIGDREFVFKGRRYQWTGEKVEYLRHEDAKLYMRVGTDWYKEIDEPVPESEDKFVRTIAKWTKGALLEDYKKYKDFIDELPRYDGFTAEPKWTTGYRRKVKNLFNLMNAMEHMPKEGPIESILKFLKHIFGGQATVENPIKGDSFTVALDWFTLLYTHPRQRLPVPILVSPENGTGKSTLLDLLKLIYSSNAVVMNNQQFAMSFNAHYASKFLIMIDEGFLEVEKKAEKERIKQLATAKEILVQFKGADLRPIPYYGKLIICSNDADRVMKIEEGESRWFVVRVPVAKEKDPDLLKKMEIEIPAFLQFLGTREIFHKKADRLWFAPEDFITDQFNKIVENTKNRLDKVVESFIKETFLTFKQSPLHIPNKQLVEQINKTAKYKLDETDLRDYLKKKEMKTNPKGSQRFRFPVHWQKDLNHQMEIVYVEGVGRYYEFLPEQWLNADELDEFSKPLDIMLKDEHGIPKAPSQLDLMVAEAQKDTAGW
jgi:hypothetical protein